MNTNALWSRRLAITGFIMIIIGTVDPLEGSLAILAGSIVTAAAAWAGRTRNRPLAVTALICTLLGVGALWILSMQGGVGGDTGRSMWWLLLCVPYPVGWLLAIISAVQIMRSPFIAGGLMTGVGMVIAFLGAMIASHEHHLVGAILIGVALLLVGTGALLIVQGWQERQSTRKRDAESPPPDQTEVP